MQIENIVYCKYYNAYIQHFTILIFNLSYSSLTFLSFPLPLPRTYFELHNLLLFQLFYLFTLLIPSTLPTFIHLHILLLFLFSHTLSPILAIVESIKYLSRPQLCYQHYGDLFCCILGQLVIPIALACEKNKKN